MMDQQHSNNKQNAKFILENVQFLPDNHQKSFADLKKQLLDDDIPITGPQKNYLDGMYEMVISKKFDLPKVPQHIDLKKRKKNSLR